MRSTEWVGCVILTVELVGIITICRWDYCSIEPNMDATKDEDGTPPEKIDELCYPNTSGDKFATIYQPTLVHVPTALRSTGWKATLFRILCSQRAAALCVLYKDTITSIC